MLDLGLLFTQKENGDIVLDVSELQNMITDYIYFPDNKTVQQEFTQEVIEQLSDVIKGDKSLEEVVKEVYDRNGYEYACRIVEDATFPLSKDDYESLADELEVSVVETYGSNLYRGMGLADLNIDDVYTNICTVDDATDDLLSGLLNMESIMEGKHESGLKFVSYKCPEMEEYMGYLI